MPLRYLTTRLACVIWLFEGLEVHVASIFVMVAISGQVEMDNQLRHPISMRISCVVSTCSSGGSFDFGIESTGYPLLYGLRGAFTGPSIVLSWGETALTTGFWYAAFLCCDCY